MVLIDIEIKKIDIDKLIDVLKVAKEKDLDDDVVFELNDKYKSVTLWLNENAWKELKKFESDAEYLVGD